MRGVINYLYIYVRESRRIEMTNEREKICFAFSAVFRAFSFLGPFFQTALSNKKPKNEHFFTLPRKKRGHERQKVPSSCELFSRLFCIKRSTQHELK